jgi:putative endonuclease
MFYVYILQSVKDKKLYVGFTNDLDERLKEHNNEINPSTKFRLPVRLIFYESLPTKEEALEREKFYKSGRGKEVLKKILFITLAAGI